jgi:hypothetical protein
MARFHLTAKSSNAKTGPIAVTTSSADTCPTTCPLITAGDATPHRVPLSCIGIRSASGERGGSWLDLQDAIGKAKLAPGSLLRHNQAGDLPHENGVINWPIVRYLKTIFQAAQLRAFTYTHHAQTEYNLMVVADCNAAGFTVNLSCDSEIQAARRHLDGFPSVCVVPADDARRSWEVAGVKVQTCPAQLKDGVHLRYLPTVHQGGSFLRRGF